MILKKDFYFVRHGQTDYNLIKDLKVDCDDIPLNPTGVQQAHSIESIISKLPIKSIGCSPLKRAKQTKEIVTRNLVASHQEIDHLSECNLQIWNDMMFHGVNAHTHGSEMVKGFMQQTLSGVNQALSLQGPVLIVAHGGVHWAICCLL
jgi:uncharacterized phosphatase